LNPNKDLYKHLAPGSQKLRVLHIGNIANNGYNIANLFNQAGMQSDLIIGPYYHIAGCPEWEDSEFEGDIGDQFFPNWHKVKITNGFTRPRWAVQGPWEICIRYLLHRNKGNKVRARLFWYWLALCRRSAANEFTAKIKVPSVLGSPKKISNVLKGKAQFAHGEIKNWVYLVFWKTKNWLYLAFWKTKNWLYLALWKTRNWFYLAIWKTKNWLYIAFWKIKNVLYLTKYYTIFSVFRITKYALLSNSCTTPLFYRLREVRRQFSGFYDKERSDRESKKVIQMASDAVLDLSTSNTQMSNAQEADIQSFNEEISIDCVAESDSAEASSLARFRNVQETELLGHQALADQLKPLFEYYDVIVGYSTDGIWPMLAGKKYVAYEHGTIRTLPFEDSLQGRLCELIYQQAQEVIISNFDNNLAAKKLGLQRYTCIPHYINEMDVSFERGAEIRAHYKSTQNADFIVYNPSRQHWSEKQDAGWEKGNDIFIRGFALFVKKVNTNALAIMTHWGDSLEASKQLIADLGIERNIDWIEPVPHKQMIEYIHASHVVSDQFLLGTFGGIPAKAFMHGRPVLSSFDASIHEWCFSSMPPFLPAQSVTDIVDSLKNCYQNNDFYGKTAQESIKWYKEQHSNEVLLTRMSEVMLNVVN